MGGWEGWGITVKNQNLSTLQDTFVQLYNNYVCIYTLNYVMHKL